MINRIIGALCSSRSNISSGFTSVPFISIVIFSSKCGWAPNGAIPNKTEKIIKTGKLKFSKNLRILLISYILIPNIKDNQFFNEFPVKTSHFSDSLYNYGYEKLFSKLLFGTVTNGSLCQYLRT